MKEVQLLWVYSSRIDSGFGVNLHTHEYYHLISLAEGSLEYRLGETLYPLLPGDTVLAPQGMPHGFENRSGASVLYYEIKFTVLSPALGRLLSELDPGPLRDPFAARLSSQIVEEYRDHLELMDDSASAALMTLIFHMTRGVRKKAAPAPGLIDTAGYSPLAARVADFLSEHYAEALSLDDISAGVGITKTYLCNAFKKSTGMTILECLNMIRIRRAAELIVYSDLSLSQVAKACGYVSVSHFNRVFMRYAGLPPGQCRHAYTSRNLLREEGQRHTDAFMFSVLAGKSISPATVNAFLARKGKESEKWN